MTLHIPTLILPSEPLSPLTWVAYLFLGLSIRLYVGFWNGAMVHAMRTPRVSMSQRIFWTLCILINPTATVWYWCVWQRYAFWALFTPMLGIFLSSPLVVRSLMSKADATMLTDALFVLGSNAFVIFFAVLLIYPIILRLMVALDLTKNNDISAHERNDWVVTMALPSIGFGVALIYAARHQRNWAFASIAWLGVLVLSGKIMFLNLAPILLPAGEEKREAYRAEKHATTTIPEVLETDEAH